MGTHATVLMKYDEEENVRYNGFQLNADGSIENIGPKLMQLDTVEKVKSFRKKKGIPVISEEDYTYWLEVESPYPVYYFDATGEKAEWMYKEKYTCLKDGSKVDINKTLKEQIEAVLKEMSDSTDKPDSANKPVSTNKEDSFPEFF